MTKLVNIEAGTDSYLVNPDAIAYIGPSRGGSIIHFTSAPPINVPTTNPDELALFLSKEAGILISGTR